MNSGKVIYEIAHLSRKIAIKQLIATALTSTCTYNFYMSLASSPVFGLHWGYHALFAAYGAATMTRNFLYESCTVASMTLLPDGKRLHIQTSGLFPASREVPIKNLSSRWEKNKVYVSAPLKGFYLLHIEPPALISTAIQIPDLELLKRVLEGSEIK